MTSITLPPLPDYVRLAAALGHIAANQLCVTKWKDGIDIEVPCGDVDQMFRVRDQEIVRCVLEAAAKVARDAYLSELADAIRALEFRHE